ncbi:MAG: hypothetical protein AABW80_00875 [Nanoarchaeota archaeon]
MANHYEIFVKALETREEVETLPKRIGAEDRDSERKRLEDGLKGILYGTYNDGDPNKPASVDATPINEQSIHVATSQMTALAKQHSYAPNLDAFVSEIPEGKLEQLLAVKSPISKNARESDADFLDLHSEYMQMKELVSHYTAGGEVRSEKEAKKIIELGREGAADVAVANMKAKGYNEPYVLEAVRSRMLHDIGDGAVDFAKLRDYAKPQLEKQLEKVKAKYDVAVASGKDLYKIAREATKKALEGDTETRQNAIGAIYAVEKGRVKKQEE